MASPAAGKRAPACGATGGVKGPVRFTAKGGGKFWQGWPAKILDDIAFSLMNEIFKADGLARWSLKHRWLLNDKKPGPRTLKLEYNQKIEFKAGQTITHYYARRCVRCVQAGKLAAIAGNSDKARMYWAMAETAAERLYSSWLHMLAAKEASRINGVKHFAESQAGDTRDRVKKALDRLATADRVKRGMPKIIAASLNMSETQVRIHMKALGYGARNKKTRCLERRFL